MRQITKDIQITIDGSPQGFRLTKPDAFSGVEILRLLLRLQDQRPDGNPSVLDLITSLSGDELRSVMTSCLNHVSVLLPAGPVISCLCSTFRAVSSTIPIPAAGAAREEEVQRLPPGKPAIIPLRRGIPARRRRQRLLRVMRWRRFSIGRGLVVSRRYPA